MWRLLVANLEWIFEQSGGEQPYDVWIKTVPGADFEKIVQDLREYEITVMDYQAAPTRIAEELRRPERQGLFGVLSVGFLAASSNWVPCAPSAFPRSSLPSF